MRRVGKTLGATQLGMTVYELPPARRSARSTTRTPKEWLLELQGRPTLRHPDGSHVLEPWDRVCFPSRPGRETRPTT
jgi:uncharacterized cupin superfamily protein